MIAFASDDEITIMGKISAVQPKLKEIAPQIYIQKCSCHSLHLCSSSVRKKLPDEVE